MNVQTTDYSNRLQGDIVYSDVKAMSSWSDGEISALCNTGIKIVIVEEPVLLSLANPSTAHVSLGFLACLKSATARGLQINWSLEEHCDIHCGLLSYLWPPTSDVSDDSAGDYWRKTYRFGQCYWRNGGSYIEVIDKRDRENQMQHILEEKLMLEIFRTAIIPCPRTQLSALSEDALLQLEEAGLILSGADLSLTLPYRIAQWPVPYRSI